MKSLTAVSIYKRNLVGQKVIVNWSNFTEMASSVLLYAKVIIKIVSGNYHFSYIFSIDFMKADNLSRVATSRNEQCPIIGLDLINQSN